MEHKFYVLLLMKWLISVIWGCGAYRVNRVGKSYVGWVTVRDPLALYKLRLNKNKGKFFGKL